MKLTEHFPAHKVDRSGGITPSHEDAPADAAPGGPVRTAAPDDGFLPHVAARAALRAVGGRGQSPYTSRSSSNFLRPSYAQVFLKDPAELDRSDAMTVVVDGALTWPIIAARGA